MEILYITFEAVMNVCYQLCKNYGAAILLFTLISKIVLLPVSVWVQKNSIKMVKMQPEINLIMVKHFGDKDMIAEEQAAVYKRSYFGGNHVSVQVIRHRRGSKIKCSYGI